MATYTYDAAGHRLTGGGSTFSWDQLGRLASSTSGGSTTTYTLDGDGRRVGATTGGTTTPYLWDVAAPYDELVSDGSATYLHANGTALAQQSAASIVYPLTDALGSVRALTDAGGAVTGTATYDVFGATTAQTGVASRFGFTGEMTDPAGVYLRARTLDPTTGAFLSTDPIRPGAAGVVGYNQYSYAGNNPTTWTDPSGQDLAFYSFAVSRALLIAVALTGLALVATIAITQVALCLAGVTCPLIFHPGDSTDDPTGTGGGPGGGGAPSIPLPWASEAWSAAVAAALAALGIVAADLALRDNMPIYRVWGGPFAPEDGRSWTPVNPALIETLGPGTYRNLAGLPNRNTGEFLATGYIDLLTLVRTTGTSILEVLASELLDGNEGGLPEIRFLNRADVRANVRNITSYPAIPPY